ncbi:MAG: FecR domain-containing protein [Syntrophobacter sp.]
MIKKRFDDSPILISVILSLICFSMCGTLQAFAAERCEDWVARVVSAQGYVQCRATGETRWTDLKLDDIVCPGDMVRVLENSRAALVFRNQAIVRLDQNTTVILPTAEKRATEINLLSGVALFFSRFPFSLRIFTPFVSADVEGTEFLIKVTGSETSISVFEGRVKASNQAGSLAIGKGETAAARAGEAPVMGVTVRPKDAVNWALYYPPIPDRELDASIDESAAWGAAVRESLEAWRRGDLARAFARLGKVRSDERSPVFLAWRAFLHVSVGRWEEAVSDLDSAIAVDPHYSYAFALKSVVALVQNRKDEAARLAERAVELDRSSAAALIALSYVKQARFDLKGALSSVEQAARVDPRDALVRARLSELWLSKGYLDRALNAAQEAVNRNPDLARTQSVLGYAYLTQIKIDESKKAFRKAIRLDQADPLPRLGLGLALIRDGDLKAGRAEIEIAVMLDPLNSLIRSYLGKAYFDEKQDKRAAIQFGQAKELDPKDPTPWFYEAIQKETQNRPVDALDDLEKSIQLNDNRAVYRSRLMLDQDLAARSASLARIYQDLGFDQRALVEGWKSLNTDPANYSAHRFLSDAYSNMPRHNIARVSELLQSQLLQPLNLNPIQPEMREKNLLLPSASGPANPSFNEYNSLFTRNKADLLVSGAAGEHGTLADEAILSGVYGRYSASLGQYHYETDGLFRNNDIRRNLYNAFTQVMVTPSLSFLAEYRNMNIWNGDLSMTFNPADASLQRDIRDSESFRLGMHASISPNSDVIAHFSYSDVDIDARLPAFDIAGLDFLHAKNFEAQYLYRSEVFSAIVGGGALWAGHNSDLTYAGESLGAGHLDLTHGVGYGYTYFTWPENMTWTLGLSGNADSGFIIPGYGKEQINPKLGLTWNPCPGTTIRAAGFRTLVGPGVNPGVFSGETIEPTQVAGFNQYFDEGAGTSAWRYGVGIDQKFSSHLYGGVEYSQRDAEYLGIFTQDGEVRGFDVDEKLARAYLYWTPHSWFAIGPEYLFEQTRTPNNVTLNSLSELNTHRITFGGSFFHPSGFFAVVKPTLVFQDGQFIREMRPYPEPSLFDHRSSEFFVLDAAVGYRLPRRLGFISIEVRNMFDESFRFQDMDPFTTSFYPKRWVMGRITLFF